MSLDVHAHLFPMEYIETIRAMGGVSASLADRLEEGNRRSPFMGGSVDQRVDLLAEAGIDRQVLSMTGQHVLVEDRARCRDHARAGNDVLANVCARYPEAFSFFAVLPLVDAEGSIREMERAAKDLGALGMVMPTHVLGRPLDWSELEPLYAYMEQAELPIFLHPGPPWHPVTPVGFNDYGITSGLYFPVEDAQAVMRLVLSGMLERHPGLRIICPHLGGPIPFLFYRLDNHVHPTMSNGEPLPHPPSVYLKRLLYDVVSQHMPAVRCACDTFGVDRLVLGTDFPFVPQKGVLATMASVRSLTSDDSEQANILENTVRSWLPL